MQKKTNVLITLLAWLTLSLFVHYEASASTGSTWSHEVRKHAEQYLLSDSNTFIATIYGVCGLSWPWQKKHGAYRTRNQTDTKLEDRIPVKIVKTYQSKASVDGESKVSEAPKKAPLIFFLPGMFNEVEDGQPSRFLRDLSHRGHHVVTLPNPLSQDFISAKPEYKPGNFVEEAKTLYRVIKRITLSFRLQGLLLDNEIRLVGVSYGALLAAIITNLDLDDSKLFNQSTTLISPPINFDKALKRLDSFVEDTNDEFIELGLHSKLYRFLRVCYSGDFSRKGDWAKALAVHYGFRSSLVESVKTYRKLNGIVDLPDGDPNWENYLTFKKYLNWYAPEVESLLSSEKALLFHWVDRAKRMGMDFRILAAKDDWLNIESEWKFLSNKDLILLPGGGHFGFRKMDWFSQFLTMAFPIP